MAQINFPHSESAQLDEPPSGDVWPALVNVYQEQGYEADYARAVSDVLADALEATEEFIQSQAHSDAETRRLLYAFSEFLENRVRRKAPAEEHRLFIDGLGI